MLVKIDRTTRILSLLAMLGVAWLILTTTRWGIGTTYDSVYYVDAARHLAEGRGFTTSVGGKPELLSHWPPLYSMLLAGFGVFGIDPIVGARWLNALLFGANILLVGLVVKRSTGDAVWITVFSAILMLTSVDMLTIHAVAWTEPAFIFFGVLGLSLLSAYLEKSTFRSLICASMSIAAAFLTRYAGLPLVGAGMAVVFLFGEQKLPKRMVRSGILGAVAALPIVLWVIRILSRAGTASATRAKGMTWHPLTWQQIRSAMDTISEWLLPAQLPELIRTAVLLVVLTAFTMWILLFALNSTEKHRKELGRLGLRLSPFLAFMICYGGFLVISISLYDAATPLDLRILAPIYPVALIIGLCVFNMVLTCQWAKRLGRLTVIMVCTTLTGSYVVRAAIWSYNNWAEGIGWSGKTWANSEIINRIREMPPGTTLFSNRPSGVYLLTGRPAVLIPQKMSDANLRRNDAYSKDVARMRAILAKEGGRLVYFRVGRQSTGMPSEEELKKQLRLRAVAKGENGVIYEVERY